MIKGRVYVVLDSDGFFVELFARSGDALAYAKTQRGRETKIIPYTIAKGQITEEKPWYVFSGANCKYCGVYECLKHFQPEYLVYVWK